MTGSSWPPPADESTVWSVVRRYTTWPHSESVRVRTVRLWGRDVQINDAGEVWCPSCQQFVATELLGRPGNGHPVGIRWPSSTIWVTHEDEDDVAPTLSPLQAVLQGRPERQYW